MNLKDKIRENFSYKTSEERIQSLLNDKEEFFEILNSKLLSNLAADELTDVRNIDEEIYRVILEMLTGKRFDDLTTTATDVQTKHLVTVLDEVGIKNHLTGNKIQDTDTLDSIAASIFMYDDGGSIESLEAYLDSKTTNTISYSSINVYGGNDAIMTDIFQATTFLGLLPIISSITTSELFQLGLIKDPNLTNNIIEANNTLKDLVNNQDFIKLFSATQNLPAIQNLNITPHIHREIHKLLSQNFTRDLSAYITSNTSILDAFNDLQTNITLTPTSDDLKTSEVLTSKSDLQKNTSIPDFRDKYNDFKDAIKNAYSSTAPHPPELTYLYKQFVLNENQKIDLLEVSSVQTIASATHNRVQSVLDSMEELTGNNDDTKNKADLKRYQEGSAKYVNEVSSIRIGEVSTKTLKLRSDRINLASVKALVASKQLNISPEDLANGKGIKEIQKAVFSQAIKADLDDLFLQYEQKGGIPRKVKQFTNRNTMRGRFSQLINKKYGKWGSPIAGGVNVGIAVASRVGLAGVSTAMGFPPVLLGGLLAKNAGRRLLNSAYIQGKLKSAAGKDHSIHDSVALNFAEATRDSIGNGQDSLFADKEHITNDYILRQQNSIKELEQKLGPEIERKVRGEFSSEFTKLKGLLSNRSSSDFVKEALNLQQKISKRIVELYSIEYEKILEKIENKTRSDVYLLRSAAEFAAGMVITETAKLAFQLTSEGAKGIWNYLWGSEAQAAPTNLPKAGDADAANNARLKDTTTPSSSHTPETPKANTPNTPPPATTIPSSSSDAVKFRVPTDTDILNAAAAQNVKAPNLDPGLGKMLEALSGRKGSLTSSQILEIGRAMEKQGNLTNMHVIKDAWNYNLEGEALQKFMDYTGVKPDTANLLRNYIKLNHR